MSGAIRIGVSSCLLGQRVRYDGGHKHDRHLTGILGRIFTLVPVCPEVGCGLPVPREAMRLEGDPAEPRLITIESRLDLTGRMRDYCRRTMVGLEREELSGFIFKSRSPSCGLFGVAVYQGDQPAGTGRGLFAAAVTAHFPLLPVGEEGCLATRELRDEFVERVFACRRRQEPVAAKGGAGEPEATG